MKQIASDLKALYDSMLVQKAVPEKYHFIIEKEKKQTDQQSQDPRLDLYKEVHWANLGQKSACVGVNGLDMHLY